MSPDGNHHMAGVDAAGAMRPSRVIEHLEMGGEAIICRAGKPVAKMVPLVTHVKRIGRCPLRGKVVLADGWDSPETNASIAADFGLDG